MGTQQAMLHTRALHRMPHGNHKQVYSASMRTSLHSHRPTWPKASKQHYASALHPTYLSCHLRGFICPPFLQTWTVSWPCSSQSHHLVASTAGHPFLLPFFSLLRLTPLPTLYCIPTHWGARTGHPNFNSHSGGVACAEGVDTLGWATLLY